MISRQLWLPAQNLNEIKPTIILEGVNDLQDPYLTYELLAINTFWEMFLIEEMVTGRFSMEGF